ncbi:MAG: 50S ribosomal protein L2 [bacterium]|nr:50S ribosomal protein L2 [bacterium]
MKLYKPTTPGRRGMTVIEYRKFLSKKTKEKSLTFGFKRSVGRNSAGRITTRHKGSGNKRLYRLVSFKYDKKGIPAKVIGIEYDPNRSAFIAAVNYKDGEKRYLLADKEMKEGQAIIHDENAPVQSGNALPLSKMTPGTFVYNVELKPDGGAKLIRSAGSHAEVIAQEDNYTTLKMPSKEIRKIPAKSWATVGVPSNEEHGFVVFGKAGRSRHAGIRPTVRGSAMNPVDHPYGGGEGAQPRGTNRPKNKWGRGTRGVKTRDKKKYSTRLIVSRRPKTKRKK